MRDPRLLGVRGMLFRQRTLLSEKLRPPWFAARHSGTRARAGRAGIHTLNREMDSGLALRRTHAMTETPVETTSAGPAARSFLPARVGARAARQPFARPRPDVPVQAPASSDAPRRVSTPQVSSAAPPGKTAVAASPAPPPGIAARRSRPAKPWKSELRPQTGPMRSEYPSGKRAACRLPFHSPLLSAGSTIPAKPGSATKSDWNRPRRRVPAGPLAGAGTGSVTAVTRAPKPEMMR